jgi:hypothetical protein
MIDTSELDDWAAAVAAASRDALAKGERIISRGALNVKREAARMAPHGRFTPKYAASINYDVATGTDHVEAEIGPDHSRPQGPLGNLLEYGSPTSPPYPHLEPAGDAEEPRLYEQAEKLAVELMGRYG